MASVTSVQGSTCPCAAAQQLQRRRGAAQLAFPSRHAGSRQQQKRRGRAASASVAAALPAATLADAALAASAAGGDLQLWVLPTVVGLGLAAAGLAAVRLSSYSQLEYVTAAMLARHVKAGGARVLQLGGSTRDIYYYPAGTMQVTVGGPDVKAGLWEQVGMQAKVPVAAVMQDVQKILSSQAGSTFDSVVLVNQMGQWADPQQLLSQVVRVLKPGGTFVFIQRLKAGPLQAVLGGGAGAVDAAVLEAVQQYGSWDFVQWDEALEGTDPHAVGVAIKPLSGAGGRGGAPGASVDTVAFEQVMKRNKKQQRQQQQQAGGGFSRE